MHVIDLFMIQIALLFLIDYKDINDFISFSLPSPFYSLSASPFLFFSLPPSITPPLSLRCPFKIV